MPIIAPDAASLAAAVAARTITVLSDRLAQSPVAHLCLTGGTIGTASLAAIAASPAVHSVDWRRVHVWWSDERFEPTGDALRNETDARSEFLDLVPVLDTNVHPMPAPGSSWGDDVNAAAAAYAETVLREGGGQVPTWDVLMLGVGPDGHVASLFPGLPGMSEPGTVISVTGSPKPPPVRLSFTLSTINAAREVWLVASGGSKAEAMGRALNEGESSGLPAAMVHGTVRTLALLDADAAAGLAAH